MVTAMKKKLKLPKSVKFVHTEESLHALTLADWTGVSRGEYLSERHTGEIVPS